MKGFIKFAALVVACVFLLAAPATYGRNLHEPVMPGKAAIKSVTVYPDRAMVVRSGGVQLDAGVHELVFEDLPPAILRDSVRAKGTDKIRVTDVKMKSIPLARPDDPAVREAQKKVEGLEKQMRTLQDDIAVLVKKAEFLESIKLRAGQQASESKIDVNALKQLMEIYEGGYREVIEKKRELDFAMKEVKEELDAARRELQALQSRMSLTKLNAVVSVVAEEKAAGEIELSYTVGNASWYAEYDVRATSDTASADIEYYGVIRQQSGEDWKDAQIMLTTAQPALVGRLPELYPRYLRIYRPEFSKGAKSSEDFRGGVEDEVGVAGGPRSAPQVEIIERAGLAVTYVLPRKETIPSSREPHRTLISVATLKPEKTYITVPRLTDKVYQQAEFANNTKLAFLPGRANIYLGPDYIGTTVMPAVAPTGKFKINYGADQQFKVKRERVNRFEEDIGTKKKRITYEYKIALQSFKEKPVTLLLQDQIPVSTHEDIKVKLLKTSVQPEHENNRRDKNHPAVIAFREKGIIEWRLELAPNPEKEMVVAFSYEVEFPAGAVIDGLE
ncbi:MAG: mucoidy inhibitor MuiA family protein [Planctomycetota bacterium]